MVKQSSFEKIYQSLNPAQKKAVDSVEGPVMVIAGPGTGKTQILTLRIANILLATQVNPDNILALTFTDSAVLSMRKRLSEIIGTLSYRVEITTFHSFCNDVIHAYPEDFPHLIASSSISEIEQIQLLEEIVERSKIEILKPFGDPFYYLKTILGAINDLKKEGISVRDFKTGIDKQISDFAKISDLYHEKGPYKGAMKGKYSQRQRNIQKQEELLSLYEKYQQALQEKKMYDFNDMLIEVILNLAKNKDLLLRIQEVYQYVLVDEHQDTNSAQNRLIELICNFHPNPNLFVVGDEKQAIFRFQGASLENFLYFQNLYPQAILINLQSNYRSTQTILNAAGSLIKKNISSGIIEKVDLKSSTKYKEEKVKVAALDDFFGEYFFLAEDIQTKITQGISPKEIAVLSRNNRDLLGLVDVFSQKGIQFNIEADLNIFIDPQIKKLLLLLKAIQNYGQDLETIMVLHGDYLKINPLDLYKIIKVANSTRQTVCELISKRENLAEAQIEDQDKLIKFGHLLSGWKECLENENLETLFAKVLNESGLLDHIIKLPNSLELLDKLTALFEEVKLQTVKNPQFSLGDFLNYLDLLKQHNLLVKRPPKTTLREGVRLMTVHKAKGQEFEYVYIINVFDGHWGNMRKRSTGIDIPWEYFGVKLEIGLDLEENEDERRLFYVSLTRAKKGATISYSTCSLEGKEQLPSQFISEIDDDFKQILDTTRFNQQFGLKKEVIFAPKNLSTKQVKNQQFFQELFLERGLSVSGLNNYLKCPWRFFYRNLLALPQPNDRNMMFGSAIHKALSKYVSDLNKGVASNLRLIEGFIDSLSQQPLRQKDFDELVKKGQRILQNYFDKRLIKWEKGIESEVKIKGVRLTPEIKLNGVIDLIEKKENNKAVIYDFKTGKPKTRGEIEGTTINSSGDYLRQLIFYKLLIDKYFNGRLNVIEGVIDFIDTDVKGKIRSEVFEITKQQVGELEKLILRVSKEIINLEFWDFRCNDKDCEYCQLRALMN